MFNIPTYLIEQQILTAAAASVTFDDITAQVAAITAWTPRHLLLRVNGLTDGGYDLSTMKMQFNGDTGNNYHDQRVQGDGSSATAARRDSQNHYLGLFIPDQATGGTSGYGGGSVLVPDAFSTRSHKSILSFGGAIEDRVYAVAGRWGNTSIITSVVLTPDGGDWVSGSSFDLCVVDESFNHTEEII